MKDMFKKGDVVVVLFHDHGSRYVGKMFNDDWMRERGFLEEDHKTAEDLLSGREDNPLITIGVGELVSHAVAKMRTYQISQIPVTKGGEFVGMVNETTLINQMVDGTNIQDETIDKVMGAPLPIVKPDASIKELSQLIKKDVPAVLVDFGNNKYRIVTRHDVISAMT